MARVAVTSTLAFAYRTPAPNITRYAPRGAPYRHLGRRNQEPGALAAGRAYCPFWSTSARMTTMASADNAA
jgi:hypothetical protein